MKKTKKSVFPAKSLFCLFKHSPKLSNPSLSNNNSSTMANANFRFQARAVFLTYPKCPISTADALTLLRTKLGEADGTHYLIAQEDHADGSKHLHIFVERNEIINTRNARYFDIEDATGTYHPNVTAPRDRDNVKTYVSKHGNYIIWPADWNWQSPPTKRSKWQEATPLLMEGQTAAQLLQTMPDFVLANLKKVQEASAFLANLELLKQVPPLAEFLTWDLPLECELSRNPQALIVWNELRDNLANMDFGRRQLYLYGPTGIGKSVFLHHLMLAVRTYMIPTEDFYDMWEDSRYDLSVMEEFKGQKPIQWFNQWLDGATLNVRQKGKQALKKKAVPTLILSNFDVNGPDVYPNMQESVSIVTLRRRLRSLPVTQDIMHALTSGLRLFLSAKEKTLPKITPLEPQAIQAPNPLFVRGTANPQ